MYKRAYLFSGNAPPTFKDSDSNPEEEDKPEDSDKSEAEETEEEAGEGDAIRHHPGNKVAYCIHCKGKTFLNEDSIAKHINSKNHLKNVKKTAKQKTAIKDAKKEFLKRMDEVDKSTFGL